MEMGLESEGCKVAGRIVVGIAWIWRPSTVDGITVDPLWPSRKLGVSISSINVRDGRASIWRCRAKFDVG